MPGWLQNLVVGLAVVAAFLYATWLLLPARLRFSALGRIEARLGRVSSMPAARVARWLRERWVTPLRARAARASGCGDCPVGPAPGAAGVRRGPGRP